jgi:two-component system phosphate regulon sensor histidine kinase PhoR
MRSSTTRILILSLSIIIAAIVGLQLHWLQKTYDYEAHEFNTSVIKSIRGLYEDLYLVEDAGTKFGKLVERPDAETFIFRTDSMPDQDSLVYYLTSEFDDFNVYTDCKVGLYDGKQRKYTYEKYIRWAGSTNNSNPAPLPIVDADHSFICFYFPYRDQFILKQMNVWILTSVLLLVLLTGFAFSIYYFFKQKFFNDIQKDFINNITHEFSTPLTVIELSTEALERPSVLNQQEKVSRYVRSISYQTEYLKKHIQNLMKTVVAENPSFSIQRSAVVPNALIRQAVSQLEPIIEEKKGAFVMELEETEFEIQADPDNLFLAIFNILTNALKYSPQPRIMISTYHTGSHYYILVKDNGIGIDKADIKKVFRKFYRAQKGNLHNVKGLGLGLYFSKKVIDLHKGNINVQSIMDVGTEFKIELPVNNTHNGNQSKNITG